MKRLSWILPVVVAIALLVGFMRARWNVGAQTLPSFTQTPPPVFNELRAPIGTASLRGRVVDVDGEPVADVSLYLRSGDVPLWVTSGADGRFVFEGVSASELEVVVLAWGHPPWTQKLSTGDAEQDVVLLPANAPPPVVPDIAYAPVSGRVAHPLGGRWADGEGYEVVFMPRAPANELGGAVERRASTDAAGFFALDDLALGAYTVAVLPHWARGGTWPDLVQPELADFDHGTQDAGSNIFPLSCGALEALVLDPEGAAVEGALVLLCDAERPSHVWLPQSTDPLGRARFLDLPPGKYQLLIRAGEAQPPEVAVAIEPGEVARPAIPPLVVRKREQQ